MSLGTASRRFERTQCLYLKGVMGYKKSDSPFFILAPPPFQPRKMRAQKFLPIISKTPDIRHCVTSQNTSLLKLDRCRNVDSRYHTTLLYYSSIKPRCHFPVYFPSNYIRSCTVPFFFFLNAFESFYELPLSVSTNRVPSALLTSASKCCYCNFIYRDGSH